MFQKQLPMRHVSYSMIPIFLYAIYLFGWRVLALFAFVLPVAIFSEFIFVNGRKNAKVSEAIFVTTMLYVLSLPPAVPLWVAGVGIIFGVIIGKEVYGGFGRNIFNPAILARLFVYISFPILMQTTWIFPGAFGMKGVALEAIKASFVSTWQESVVLIILAWVFLFLAVKNKENKKAPVILGLVLIVLTVVAYLVLGIFVGFKPELDTISMPTPLVYYGKSGFTLANSFYLPTDSSNISLMSLFFGTRIGSIGEGSIFLILLAYIYLTHIKKVANPIPAWSTFISAAVLFSALYFAGILKHKFPSFTPDGKSLLENCKYISSFLFSGSLVFAAVFMVTDPITAPKKPLSLLLYGIIIGCSTILIRVFSPSFPEGISFAILFGNAMGNLIDEYMPVKKKITKPSEGVKA